MSDRTIFEVYTYFGRILASFTVGKDELHHGAMEKARLYLVEYESTIGNAAWVRIK